jgi:ferredoxin
MADLEERTIGGLVVRIDRLLCVGFGDCIDEADGGLVLDDEGIATFTPAADGLVRERVLAACRACPVDAITVLENGTQIAP